MSRPWLEKIKCLGAGGELAYCVSEDPLCIVMAIANLVQILRGIGMLLSVMVIANCKFGSGPGGGQPLTMALVVCMTVKVP